MQILVNLAALFLSKITNWHGFFGHPVFFRSLGECESTCRYHMRRPGEGGAGLPPTRPGEGGAGLPPVS